MRRPPLVWSPRSRPMLCVPSCRSRVSSTRRGHAQCLPVHTVAPSNSPQTPVSSEEHFSSSDNRCFHLQSSFGFSSRLGSFNISQAPFLSDLLQWPSGSELGFAPCGLEFESQPRRTLFPFSPSLTGGPAAPVTSGVSSFFFPAPLQRRWAWPKPSSRLCAQLSQIQRRFGPDCPKPAQ